jgi:hypothetical protein
MDKAEKTGFKICLYSALEGVFLSVAFGLSARRA